MAESYYQILGIPTDSDEREIKRAYHRLARELHPDKAETPEAARTAEQQFAIVSTAYNVLKDAAQRRDYDRQNQVQSHETVSNQSASPTSTAAVMTAPRPSRGPTTPTHKDERAAKGGIGLTPERASIGQKAYVKGLQLVKAKDYAKAAEFFEAAIANNDSEAAYHASLGMALIQAKRSASRAIDAAERAIELDQYNLDYKFTLAQIYETIGSKSNAIKAYQEILRWDSDNKMAQQILRTLTHKPGILGKLATFQSVIETVRKKLSI